MPDFTKVEGLHRRLLDERRKVVEVSAESGTLPPSGLLAYLSDLDGAIVAVEAVLEERTSLQASADLMEGATLREVVN